MSHTIFILNVCGTLGHAKEALELSKLQEATRQQEQMAKIKEYEAAIEQSKVEQRRIDHEERRKTLQVKIFIPNTFPYLYYQSILIYLE